MQALPKVPQSIPRTNAPTTQKLGRWLLKMTGWTVVGEFPEEKKMIMAVAPHTSNWDFLVGLMTKMALDLRLNFLGKHTIFVGPLGVWLRSIGGIAIDRRSPHGVVGDMVEQFNRSEQLILAIAPEGTRSKVPNWKSGFLQMARQAGVPVFPIQFNYVKKQIEFMPIRYIGDDIDAELTDFKALFNADCAKNPQLF
ncbi:lysophospholipid acyltransferase family protein [Thalassotalea sp. HSM 43]|uniref:lysophospholipid acyltransferase family protein n=1 Tax=Thalassotalea sp. HSM 43 TaxID=2552945 RepID=UPI001E2F469D|nr:lysophospholipid acyltransferase family protein [Thalassotalea sp. HSM 43]